MKDAFLAIVWAWGWMFPFIATLGAEVWLLSAILPAPKVSEDDDRSISILRRGANLALGLGAFTLIVGIAAWVAYGLNTDVRTNSCPADYDRQGRYSDC